jgi:ABC-type antimicrobial peptide transport system permease subunit
MLLANPLVAVGRSGGGGRASILGEPSTREFGVRLAVGSTPRQLLVHVLGEGVLLVAIGIVAGVLGGYAVGRVAETYVENLRLPSILPVLGTAVVLGGAAVVASLVRAARPARVDVL